MSRGQLCGSTRVPGKAKGWSMLKVVRAKLHAIRVTGADLNYHGSITLDPEHCAEAGLYPLEALRGVALLTAVTFVAEIGDVRRFESPRQLMAYLGLVPCESSTGERVRRGSITKAGNTRVRRVLIEGAWTYRFPARMSRLLQ